MRLKLDWSAWLSDDLWLVVCCIPHNSVKPLGKQYEGNIPEYPKQLLYCLDNTCRHGAEVWVCVSNALHTFTHSHFSGSRRSELSVQLWLDRMHLKSTDLFIYSLCDNIVVSTDFNLSSRCWSLQDSKIPLLSETKLYFTCSFDNIQIDVLWRQIIHSIKF